ncbi:MAG: NAD-dependent deacylase [Cyclobacteriaceae bacterium]|nr:NAD-dependent deacylase [Cyclobacteriaceae bacterium]
MKKLVVLTGAGVSAESGIPTFRDSGGLWEGYDVMEVATPEGWAKNPTLVLEFYNQRRKKALEVQPNKGHEVLVELEKYFDVTIITQNVDNLHERAGSTHVVHLHGSLFESRSSKDDALIYPVNGWELKLGEKCELGSQLRPNIVWFGELVYKMDEAVHYAKQADIFLVVGTSLQVYPAADLIQYTRPDTQKIIVDPKKPDYRMGDIVFIEEGGGAGMEKVKKLLLS